MILGWTKQGLVVLSQIVNSQIIHVFSSVTLVIYKNTLVIKLKEIVKCDITIYFSRLLTAICCALGTMEFGMVNSSST